jgi:penicillin-binding protein 2A
MYFNAIYFGNGVYGLESASHYYFDKSVADLSLRESAALAGLIRNPARYCPLTNFDNFVLRSDLVLKLMHDQGRINEIPQETPIITTSKKVRNYSAKPPQPQKPLVC